MRFVTAPASPPAGTLADRIDALLPQTQCTRCGFAGCRPYAEAIAAGAAQIDRCPPGGAAGIERLAALLGRAVLPLNPVYGTEEPLTVAVIDESLCIGCTLCIQACPVDAIVGAARRMHTVLAQNCTGCELCVTACPIDCIAMRPVQPERAWTLADAAAARTRLQARQQRRAREARERNERLEARALAKLDKMDSGHDPSARQTERNNTAVQAAIERARARRLAATPGGTRTRADGGEAAEPPASRPLGPEGTQAR